MEVLETKTEKDIAGEQFGSAKLSFQPGMPVLQQVQEILRRGNEPESVSAEKTGLFRVRVPGKIVTAHCAACYRSGFVSVVVPA